MRVATTILGLLIVFFLRGQEEITSFYFKAPQPADVSSQKHFPEEICGTYLLNEDTLTHLIIEPDSIYTSYSIFTFITQKAIKESETIYVEDDLLKGIVKGQGLPYIERNDTLFTMFTQKETVFNPSVHELREADGVFFLSFKEKNGLYSSQVLQKKGNKLVMHYLDHEKVLARILKFETDTEKLDGFKTYISSPSKEQLISFFKENGFTDRYTYELVD